MVVLYPRFLLPDKHQREVQGLRWGCPGPRRPIGEACFLLSQACRVGLVWSWPLCFSFNFSFSIAEPPRTGLSRRKWLQKHFCNFLHCLHLLHFLHCTFLPKNALSCFFLTWSGPTANVSAWLAIGFERTFYRYIMWLSVPKPRGPLRRCCKRFFCTFYTVHDIFLQLLAWKS